MGNRVVLTLNPELVHPGVHGGRLESHAECGEDEQRDEQHFACVRVQSAPERGQACLQSCARPQRPSAAGDAPLDFNKHVNKNYTRKKNIIKKVIEKIGLITGRYVFKKRGS